MKKHTTANDRVKKPTLMILRAASDVHVWAAIWAMKCRGEVSRQVPDYGLIQAELKKLKFPVYDSKQISKCVLRLKSIGYIRSSDEFAGVDEQPPEIIQAVMEAIA